MWMMIDDNNSDHGRELKPPADPMIGRKLRPLMPRPMSSCSSSSSNTPYSTPSCCCCIRNPKILSWNHSTSDYGVKREIHTAAPLVSTRWNPTPEQLQALEEMYRRGIRTPSAEQIQQIAAKLGRFGKIEGKNVFYWFQNHKARERQKKRRQLELLAGKKMNNAHTLDTKQTGLSRRYFEIDHHKKVPIPSNCSTPSEDSASTHAAAIAPECGKDGWPQFNHKELHHNFATAENGTCCQLDLSSCLPPPPNSNNFSIIAITAHKPTGQENTNPYSSLNLITMLPPNNINDDHRDENENGNGNGNGNGNDNDNEAKENQTLQLFPTASTSAARPCEETRHTFSIGTKITPTDFIEFLPIKN